MPRIFISYSRVDNQFVEVLADKIRQVYGHDNVWFDAGLHGGDIWWEEIRDQIAARDIFIYVLTNDSVQSAYCQAEFAEARRLQKQIITVQARDRTRLTDELGDIHYVNMARGVNDADALLELIRSINMRMTKVSRRRPKPLWEPRTSKPTSSEEKQRPDDAPDVDTPTLQIPRAEREKTSSVAIKPWWKKTEFIIGAILIPIIAAIVGALIQNPAILRFGTGATPTNTAIAAAIAESPTPTISPTFTNTPTVTLTPSETLEIAAIVGTLDAQATDQQATLNVQATAAARATEYAVGTQSVVDQTATATMWTDTPTPDITASIIAYRTQDAATVTQAWIDSWTPTPTATLTPTITPSNTPTLIYLEDALLRAHTPVASNDDWTSYSQTFDGVEMVLVPAGCFMMGSNDGADDEQPVHEQCFAEPFWIDKTEVTNEQFGSIGCEDSSYQPNQPRNCVNWYDAYNFCKRNGRRLPTEAEWEYAARGLDSLIYPWGNEFDSNNVVYVTNSTQHTKPVNRQSSGDSWVGALDMSGNVREWTSSIYEPYPYVADDGREDDTSNRIRVVRAGSFGDASYFLRAAYRYQSNQLSVSSYVGFRCARDF
ncbi:SUMF1/EgtB/PvdO family nonheme iron enzyme [Chloroflexota bacterium]